jgi:putative molybdopterin biosynthesis protein
VGAADVDFVGVLVVVAGEGVATASADRSSLRSLVRSKPRWIGREVGSGARQCLDEILGGRAAPRRTARDHRGVAEAIRNGWADAGVCLRIAAAEAKLNFLTVRQEAYDLCFATDAATDPRIRALVQVIESASYRRLIDDLPGYRSTGMGTAASVS